MRRNDHTAKLAIRAAAGGWDVPPELRSEVVEVLRGIVHDAKAGARDRSRAAAALAALHRDEREWIRLSMDVETFTRLEAELAELKEALDGNSGDDRPGAAPAPEGRPGPPPDRTDG